jgi:p-hydroxybenzoate 3-monooxygenase
MVRASELLDGIESASVIELTHPFRWLTLIAAAAPSKRGTLYGVHGRGFAGQMQRGPALTRFMLQVARADTIGAWPGRSDLGGTAAAAARRG